MMITKRFPVGVLLTVTTGRLLAEIGDLYSILSWMTDDSPFTHQLPRFANECKPWLLHWFPELESVRSPETLSKLDDLVKGGRGQSGVERWLEEMKFLNPQLRGSYEVPRIPVNDHKRKNPLDELVDLIGTSRSTIVVEGCDE